MRGIRIIATTIVLVGTVYTAAAADQSHSREAFFRCKDRNGQTHYGDSMPAECAGMDTEVLNDHGMQVRLIEGDQPSREPATRERDAWRRMLVHRDVLLLAASYFCMNYVFYMFAQWLFTYLVKARGFSLLESGWLYVLPFATGAVLAGLGGLTCDALCKSIGATWGCRLPAMTGLVLVAVLLLAGVYASNAYLAVGLLSLCFGFTQFTEGAFWSASTYVAGPHTAAATGVMNTGGNAAGFLAPVVGLMVDQLGWFATLASGSAFALTGAALWLLIRIRPAEPAR